MSNQRGPQPSNLPTGAGVALVTLFDSRRGLLVEETADLAVRIVEAGASSVLVAGTVGEFYALTDDERVALFTAVRSRLPAAVPVIAHVGGVPQDRVVALAQRAAEAGADVLLALPLHIADVRAFYGAILDVSGSLPVLAYHLPQAGGVIDLDVLGSLGVHGIKDSSGDAERFDREVVGMKQRVYTGAVTLLHRSHELNAPGALLGPANIWPELCVQAITGDVDAQIELVQVAAQGAFPTLLKQRTADRWNVPPYSRTPADATLASVRDMTAPSTGR